MEFNSIIARPIFVNGLNEKQNVRTGASDRPLRIVPRAARLIRFLEGLHERKHFSRHRPVRERPRPGDSYIAHRQPGPLGRLALKTRAIWRDRSPERRPATRAANG